MFMHHRWITKGFGPNELVSTVENAFQHASVRLDGSGDGWRLGDSGGALVLCQVMPITSLGPPMVQMALLPNMRPSWQPDNTSQYASVRSCSSGMECSPSHHSSIWKGGISGYVLSSEY